MNRIVIIFLFLLPFLVKAQTIRGFEFARVDTIFNVPSELFTAFPQGVAFGGISGIEYFNNSKYLVSDRAFKSETDQNSYVFKLDSLNNITSAFRFFGVDNAESIRFDNITQKMFYAFEREDSTGIGFINEDFLPKPLAAFSMYDSLTTENRGIESLCFDLNHNLCFAFESSLKSTLPFYQVPFSGEKNAFDFSNKKVFQYPFQARECLVENQVLNGSLGNGVTEILPIENSPNTFLVMERCFDGKFANMHLFVATLPSEGNVMTKELVFNFTIQNEFLGKNQALKPDNMEGMTWGKEESGRRILFVISDDNFSPKRQKTLLLKLRESR